MEHRPLFAAAEAVSRACGELHRFGHERRLALGPDRADQALLAGAGDVAVLARQLRRDLVGRPCRAPRCSGRRASDRPPRLRARCRARHRTSTDWRARGRQTPRPPAYTAALRHVDQPRCTLRPHEVRDVELALGWCAAEPLGKLAGVGARVGAGHQRVGVGIGAQLHDAVVHPRITNRVLPGRLARDRVGIGRIAQRPARLLQRREPGLLDELEQPARRRGRAPGRRR